MRSAADIDCALEEQKVIMNGLLRLDWREQAMKVLKKERRKRLAESVEEEGLVPDAAALQAGNATHKRPAEQGEKEGASKKARV